MNDLLTYGLLVFTSFFTLINPFGVMPIFLAITTELSIEDRDKTAKKATFTSLVIMLIFAFSGQLLFKFFGISIASFKIAGGIMFLMMGMDMLQARLGKIKVTPSEVKSYVRDISITPLAIPMLSGPGSLTNAIILMEEATTVQHKIIFVVVLVAIMALTCFILLSATRLLKVIGEVGMSVMMRLMGMIVMVISMEFLFGGIKEMFNLTS